MHIFHLNICPTCSIEPLFWKFVSGYALVRCPLCGLVFLKYRQEGIENQFFSDASSTIKTADKTTGIEYWSFPHFYDQHKCIFEKYFAERLCSIVDTLTFPPQKLLDIGCGYGFFLEYAQRHIPYVKGMDMNASAVDYAKSKGLPVECRRAEELLDEHTSFDIITLCDVLEHIPDPLNLLRLCHALLNKGGILYIQVPNLTKFHLPRSISWGLPHHIWQFNHKSLQAMLNTVNLTVMEWNTGVMGVIGEFQKGGPSLFKRLEWKLATSFRIGNRLQMIAMKRF